MSSSRVGVSAVMARTHLAELRAACSLLVWFGQCARPVRHDKAPQCGSLLVLVGLSGGTKRVQQFAQGVRGGLGPHPGAVGLLGLDARLLCLTLRLIELLANLGEFGA